MELHYVTLLTLVWYVYGDEERYDATFEYHYSVLMKQAKLETGQSNLKKTDATLLELINVLTDKLDGAFETIDSLNDTIEVLKSQHTGGGSTYIRWGRNTCPDPDNGAELVYEGYAGGSHYSHSGGAANYLCLPKEPIWGQYNDAAQSQGLIYGAEYEMAGDNFQHDVPCAVCRIPRSSVLMIPGRNICYNGWTLEYSGNLVSGHYSHLHAYEHVCLDANPGKINNGHADKNGALFYYVEGRCGSLPCPPYISGRELSCSVCSYSPFQEQTILHPYD